MAGPGRIVERMQELLASSRWVMTVLPAMAVALFAADVLARAGGGGNYSGGGGGGGGGGEGIGALIYLAIMYPEIGVPLLVIVVVVGIVKYKRNPDRTTRNAVKKLEHIGGADMSGMGALKDRDPGFDEQRFIERVKKVDAAVQDAWCHGDMVPVRTLLSDGLLRRFQGQLTVMKHQGIRNAMADHSILRATIHAVEHDAHFDTVHVAIEATARDVEVDAALSYEEATARAKKERQEQYTEIWSLLRKPDARTLAGDGALGGHCPNCGAPTGDSQATRCDHCKALINSGEYDWVLAEITQPIEWRPTSTGAVPGMAELAGRDPGFNRQAAEDRASYVFWRWIEALVKASPAPLAKCATGDLRSVVADQVKVGPARLFKTAVGSVDLVACQVGEEGGRDRYHVKILWSSARSQKEQPTPSGNVLTLSRKAGAKDSGGLSYARCPVCQGPLEENDSPACDYCGADLAAGDADWVLERVMRPEELRIHPSGRAAAAAGPAGEIPVWATPDMGNPRERTLLLMRMAAVVMADGVVTKQEEKLLRAASKRWNVPLEAVQPILAGQVDPGEIAGMKPSNPAGFLSGLISAALIDGRIDSKEEKLLLDVGRNLGIPDSESRNMMNTMSKMAKAQRVA